MISSLPELQSQAIKAAIQNDWVQAVSLNLSILNQLPNDISTLNRLAKAYEKTSDLEKARKTYLKVLRLDDQNNIAATNIQLLKNKTSGSINQTPINTISLIEEPGKTKTTPLTKLAPQQTIANLETFQEVFLKPNQRRVSVTTQDKKFIGYLPDDLALLLIHLLKLGYKYEIYIKSVTASSVEIFIMEIERSKRLKNVPSFPLKDTKHYYNLLPTDPVAESPLEMNDPDEPTEDD